MGRQIFAFLLLMLAISATSWAGFELRSLNFTLTLNSDGTAHAVEEALLFINSSQSIELYQQSRAINDLSTWTARTEISDLRTHVSRAYVEISDLQVRPATVQNCNNLANTCYATMVLDYDIRPISEGATGIVEANLYKPRTTIYSIKNEALTFNRSKTDDIILPKGTSIRISIPEDSTRITFSKTPDNFNEDDLELFRFDPKTKNTYYLGQKRMFEWSGQTLSQFSLTYELEQSLEEEISQFFLQTQKRVFDSLTSTDGIAYILAAITILGSLLWLHSLNLK